MMICWTMSSLMELLRIGRTFKRILSRKLFGLKSESGILHNTTLRWAASDRAGAELVLWYDNMTNTPREVGILAIAAVLRSAGAKEIEWKTLDSWGLELWVHRWLATLSPQEIA